MEDTFTVHYHPKNRDNFVFGRILTNGDTIQKGDVYSSGDGNWAEAPSSVVGTTLQMTSRIWIRPEPGSGGMH